MSSFEDWRKRRDYEKAAQAYQQPMPWDAPAAQPAGYGVLSPANLPTEGQHPGYGVLQQGMMTDTNATGAAAGKGGTDWGAMLGMMGGAMGGGEQQAPPPPPERPQAIAREYIEDPKLMYAKYFRTAQPTRRKRRGLLGE